MASRVWLDDAFVVGESGDGCEGAEQLATSTAHSEAPTTARTPPRGRYNKGTGKKDADTGTPQRGSKPTEQHTLCVAIGEQPRQLTALTPGQGPLKKHNAFCYPWSRSCASRATVAATAWVTVDKNPCRSNSKSPATVVPPGEHTESISSHG